MKLLKKDTKPFLNVLYKLTDTRFDFNLIHSADGRLSVEMYFCDTYICSSSIQDLSIYSAFDCLIDLIVYTDKQNNQSYFNKLGVSFEIYRNRLNGKNYYSYRKNDSSNWVKISKDLASYILDCDDIEINGLHESFVSYCEHDTYFKVLLLKDMILKSVLN